MPHSLYLGSGIVQPRLREYDDAHAPSNETSSLRTTSSTSTEKYRPSLAAIQACMSYSITELTLSLLTFALFVNASILIVSASALYPQPSGTDADLFSIHALLSSSIAPIAGTLFALALLLSGTSAGIVCTIAGQMVSEGQLRWSVRPWVRRLITRSISIVPSVVVAGCVGREGLGRALEGSQVALSVILPVVSAPLIWFTCRGEYMRVEAGVRREGVGRVGVGRVGEMETETVGGMESVGGTQTVEGTEIGEGGGEERQWVQMRNHWVTATFAIVIWGVVVVMNVALLVLVGLGVA